VGSGISSCYSLLFCIYFINELIFYLTNPVEYGTIRHNEKGTSGSQDRVKSHC